MSGCSSLASSNCDPILNENPRSSLKLNESNQKIVVCELRSLLMVPDALFRSCKIDSTPKA
jgi:hypothetical protein